MFSNRFGREIVVTQHALARMNERGIDNALLVDLIETGQARYKDSARLWLSKHYDERDDNLLCVAAVIENRLVVKTVMHHFVPL